MKKLNLLYILFCAYFISNAQIQEETFNASTMPAGWSTTTTASNCQWLFGFTGPIPGSGFSNPASFPSGGALFEDNYVDSNPNSCIDNGYAVELEGPAVDLVAAGVISAAVEVIYNHQTFSNDGNFKVDVWDGSAWQNILFVDGDTPARNTGLNETSTIDVTAHINSAFKVKFVYEDENVVTYGIGIDDYKLLDTATAGIEDLIGLGFSYYPNPVINDVLTLNANEEITVINVYNSIGQKVISKTPVAMQSIVNMRNLPEGMYIVHVAIGQSEGSFKVIKQ